MELIDLIRNAICNHDQVGNQQDGQLVEDEHMVLQFELVWPSLDEVDQAEQACLSEHDDLQPGVTFQEHGNV